MLKLKEKLNSPKLQIFLLIILLSFFSFGLGFLVGSRFFESNPIIIQKND